MDEPRDCGCGVVDTCRCICHRDPNVKPCWIVRNEWLLKATALTEENR